MTNVERIWLPGNSNNIRALIFFSEFCWCGQCLEIDIAAQGDARELAIDNLILTVECELDGGYEIGPAPEKFFKIWDGGE